MKNRISILLVGFMRMLVIHRIYGEVLVQQKIRFSFQGSVCQIQSIVTAFLYDMKEYLYSIS